VGATILFIVCLVMASLPVHSPYIDSGSVPFGESWQHEYQPDFASQLLDVSPYAPTPMYTPHTFVAPPHAGTGFYQPQYQFPQPSPPAPQSCERQVSYPIIIHEEKAKVPPQNLFAPRVDRFFTCPEEQTFHCVVCQDDATIHFDGKNLNVSCGHYQCCNECRARLVRQVLRCTSCCRQMVGQYPVCGEQCEMVSEKLSQGLSTTGCPRCHQKLSKEVCGDVCTRTKTREYEKARKKLLKGTGTMVLKPEFCEANPELGMRPCSHFTKCKQHGRITQGRANQPRCPDCKESLRRRKPSLSSFRGTRVNL